MLALQRQVSTRQSFIRDIERVHINSMSVNQITNALECDCNLCCLQSSSVTEGIVLQKTRRRIAAKSDVAGFDQYIEACLTSFTFPSEQHIANKLRRLWRSVQMVRGSCWSGCSML